MMKTTPLLRWDCESFMADLRCEVVQQRGAAHGQRKARSRSRLRRSTAEIRFSRSGNRPRSACRCRRVGGAEEPWLIAGLGALGGLVRRLLRTHNLVVCLRRGRFGLADLAVLGGRQILRAERDLHL